MMKAALQISGQQRWGLYYTSVFSSVSETYDKVDVFIHNWAGPYSESDLHQMLVPQLPHNFEIQQIMVEPQIEFVPAAHWRARADASQDPNMIFRLMSQTYGIYRVNQMRSDHDYDRVIRSRSDLGMSGQPLAPSDDVIYTGMKTPNLAAEMMQDQFAIGSTKVMDVYCDMYNHLSDYATEMGGFHPEVFFRWWMIKNQIPVDETGFRAVMEGQQIDHSRRDMVGDLSKNVFAPKT